MQYEASLAIAQQAPCRAPDCTALRALQVYHDLLRVGDGSGEGMLCSFFNTIGWPATLATSEQDSFVATVLARKARRVAALVAAGLPLRAGAGRRRAPVLVFRAPGPLLSQRGGRLADRWRAAQARRSWWRARCRAPRSSRCCAAAPRARPVRACRRRRWRRWGPWPSVCAC